MIFSSNQNSLSMHFWCKLQYACIFVAAVIICIESTGNAQSTAWTGKDIGFPTPSPSTIWSNLGFNQAVSATTLAKGIGIDGEGPADNFDQISFAYAPLPVSGKISWTQPEWSGTGSNTVGRAMGLMMRNSLSSNAAMVFWGFEVDGSNNRQLTLSWRPANGADVKRWWFNDASLRSPVTTGPLKLYMERRGGYVVVGHLSSTSEPLPLYAVEFVAGNEAFAGVAFASGAGSWQSPQAFRDYDTQNGVVFRAKAVEPALDGVSTVSEGTLEIRKKTTLGIDSADGGNWVEVSGGSWQEAPDHTFLSGDHFYATVSASGMPFSITVNHTSSDSYEGDSDAFVRWGEVQNQPMIGSLFASVDGESGIESERDLLPSEAGLWVYIGNSRQGSGGEQSFSLVTFDGSAGDVFSIDGFLFLGKDAQADSNSDGVPNGWLPAGLVAGYDHDANGLTLLEEYHQGRQIGESGIYTAGPTFTVIGLSQRRAAIGFTMLDPLEVMVTYPIPGNIPVPGYPVQFWTSAEGYRFSESPDPVAGVFSEPMFARTSLNGEASLFLKLLPDAAAGDTEVLAGPPPNSPSSTPAKFFIAAYVNDPPGPVDLYPEAHTLADLRQIPYQGRRVAVSGHWMAVTSAAASGDDAEKVQLYQWDALASSWKASHQLAQPGASGFGARLAISNRMLIISAPGANKLFVYQRQGDSEYWEKRGEITIMAEIGSLAVCEDHVAVGIPSQDKVNIYKRDNQPLTDWGSAPQVLLEAPLPSDVEFGYALGFSDDAERLWVGAPPAANVGTSFGKVRIFHLNEETRVWAPSATLSGIAEDAQHRFGASAAWNDDWLVVGAPVRPESTDPQGKMVVFRNIGTSWARSSTAVLNGPLNVKEFGEYVWLAEDWVLTPYHQTGSTPPTSQAFDRIDIHRLKWELVGSEYTATATSVQTIHHAALHACVEGTSLFVSDLAGTSNNPAAIHEYVRTAKVNPNAAVNDPVGTFDFNDLDNDIIGVGLLQSPVLWSLNGSGLDQLRVAASLEPYAGTVQWLEVELEEFTGLTYRETVPIKITGHVPEGPTNLLAAAIGLNSVILTWESLDDSDVSFHLERAPLSPPNTSPTGSEIFTALATEEGSARYYLDSSAVNFQDYVYRIRSQNREGFSDYSNVAAVHWDADTDGLPDWWEAAHGGDLDPSGHLDSDTLNNLQEYQRNTNPLLTDTDIDGDGDNSDITPLSEMRNGSGLQVFTELLNP